MDKNLKIDYNDEVEMLSMLDELDNTVIIMTKRQVDGIVEWYCKEFNRILV